ncbi:PucR family transcriptional regulator [Kitasatospora sp. NPDC004289]
MSESDSTARPVFPAALVAEVRREIGSVTTEAIREIRRQVTEYDRPLAGNFGTGIHQGVATALADFADLLAGGSPSPQERADRARVYRALGRGELAEGRSLDALQAAYRIGARVVWQRVARIAQRTGAGPAQMAVLAETAFTHIERIAATSVEGYAEARHDETGSLGHRRHRLLSALTGGAPWPEVERAATVAEWPLPAEVAAVALAPGRGTDRRWLPDEVLADLNSPAPYLIWPDPASGAPPERLMDGRDAVVGPSVPTELAAESLRWARLVRQRRGAGRPVSCERMLPELLLLADEPLVRLMAHRRLAPLAGLTPRQAERLGSTLLAWLQGGHGSAADLAARLGVHPQTARQRLHRLQELFGPQLDDPDARFELEAALRLRALRAVSGTGT